MVFLSINGHLILLSVLADSFNTLPISAVPITAEGFHQLALWGSRVFSMGLQLSLPILVALLITNMALGILTRARAAIEFIRHRLSHYAADRLCADRHYAALYRHADAEFHESIDRNDSTSGCCSACSGTLKRQPGTIRQPRHPTSHLHLHRAYKYFARLYNVHC